MKLIIDIPEEAYKTIMNTSFVRDVDLTFKQSAKDIEQTNAIFSLIDALDNGTPIPDNATNGEWIIDRKVIDKSRKPTTYHFDTHCSECGFKYAYTTDKEDSIPTNYCPNCGVHMKGANR